jgi:hypothetical protein
LGRRTDRASYGSGGGYGLQLAWRIYSAKQEMKHSSSTYPSRLPFQNPPPAGQIPPSPLVIFFHDPIQQLDGTKTPALYYSLIVSAELKKDSPSKFKLLSTLNFYATFDH